jgi:uncharacterized protein (TIGR03000 family)
MLRLLRSFVAAVALAATLALLMPGTGSAQFFRPVLGFPGMGFYPVYPYPIGSFPTGTRFYPGLYPRYSYAYNPLASYTQNMGSTNGTTSTPYQPSTVEYNTKPAASSDELGKAKPVSSATPSATRSSGSRPVVREYNVSKEAETSVQPEQPARIDVEVPGQAKVFCDGIKTNLTGTLRQFITPALSPGREYSYLLRAEWKEGERTVSRDKRVAFHAGDRVTVSFLDKPLAPGALPEPKGAPR